MKAPLLMTKLVYTFALIAYGFTSFAQDAGVTAVIAPSQSNNLTMGTSYAVTVTIKNFGTASIQDVPVKFVVGVNNALDEVYTGTIAAGAEKHIPFEARLHSETPITEINAGYNQSHVWLETGLDIDLALDPTDRDALHIYPNDAVSTLMEAMDRLGFSLVKADVEKGFLRAPTFQSHSGCYQELEYRPNSRSLFGLQEIELSFVPEAHKTHVLIELDRAFRGDGYVDLTIEHDHVNLSQLCDQLERLFA